MVTAYMAFTMMMVVVVALHIGIEFQLSFQECCYSGIRVAGHTAIQLDTSLGQCHLSTATDTAANQHICIQFTQNPGQCAMSTSVGINNLGSNHYAVLYFVDLKLFRVSEMLKYFSVFVGYRNFHNTISLSLVI